MKTSNIEEFFNAIKSARAPETVTNKFLKDLGFTSSNDRLYLRVLKGLVFVDDNGSPTDRYFEFLDQSQSDRVLAEGIRDAYDDLFAINTNAQEMETEEVRGKLKTLTQGQKSDNVIRLMALTFVALCELADWTESQTVPAPVDAPQHELPPIENPETPLPQIGQSTDPKKLQLHYNIQLILPDSRDPKVFDALFSSLRKHLL